MLPLRKLLTLSSAILLLTSCGSSPRVSTSGQPLIVGDFHGGQQPIAGITIQLYAVGTTSDGSTSQALFSPAITSTAYGNFTFPTYTCPSPTALTYLVGTSGNPGFTTSNPPVAIPANNPQIALMAVLGPCGSISSLPYISVNELTTVAAVYALAPYMTSYSAIGSGSSDTAGLAAAFTLAGEYANSATGKTPGTNLPTNFVVPIAQMNTVADILAQCINSAGGTANDSTPCGTYLGMTTPTGVTPPTDAITALLNLANNPTLNTSALYGLVSATSPYQTADTTQPADLSISLTMGGSPLIFAPTAGVSFPTTTVGSTSTSQNFTITNNNSVPITISNIAFIGADINDFPITLGCLQTVAANSVCTMQVQFKPTAPGTRSAAFTLTGNASNSPTSEYLSGTAVTPGTGAISLSTTSLTMNDFATGTVNLTNLSSSTVGISSIAPSAGFSQTNGCGTSLASGAVCTVLVTPSPSVAGPLTGTLTITDTATNSPQTVALTSSLDTIQSFGNEIVGVASPITFTETAETANSEQQYSLSGTISGPDAGDFFFVGGTSGCITAKNVSSGCSIAVGMQPAALGSRVAVLTLQDGFSARTYVLSGTGVPTGPALSYVVTVAPTVPQFSSANGLGSIHNTGSTTVDLNGTPQAYFTGANAADFTNPQLYCASTTLAVGAECYTFTYIFAPQSTGTRQATLNIPDSISGTILQIPFSAVATAPPPSVSATSLSFPQTHLGATSSLDLTVAAVGASAGHSLSISVAAPFSASPATCIGTSPCTIVLSYKPTAITSPGDAASNATDTKTLKVYDATNSSLSTSVFLTGSPGIPGISLSASALSFGTGTVGIATATQPVTVTNFGDGYLQLNLGSSIIVGPNPSTVKSPDFPYTYSGATYIPIAPGGSYTFNPYFKPTATGVRDSTLNIYSNATPSPAPVTLQGTGN